MGRDQDSKRLARDSSYGYGLDTLESLDVLYKPPRTAIPYRQPLRTYEFIGVACPTPRTYTARLGLLGLGLLAVLVLVQALSCGLFYCVALPAGRASYIDLREVFTEFRLFNQPQFVDVRTADPAPMLIPRIVHQTFRSRQVPGSLKSVMQTWGRVNGPGWHTRFYDDEACVDFVRREFPEYLDAYQALPKDVERSDFFRYMVVLRLGGVYADIDVELRQPLDSVVGPTDTLVVGWEAEVSTDAEAFKRHFVRKRQVLQWFFAAAPGHPVLRAACDHIARYARHTFSNNTNRDTLERTGPGMWTDVVLRHAAAHPPTLANDPWKVRILPRVAFGVHPAGIDGLTPDAKEIVVLHHFLGSWKKRGGWHKRRSVLQILAGAASAALKRHGGGAPSTEEPIRPSVLPLFPVSAAFTPPFTVMTHLIGTGDMQSGSDVSAQLTSWGTWQAAMTRPSRKPQVVEALVGSLGPAEAGAVLVDVGAGLGYFSLAAAARGHRVVAFESSGRSIDAFSAGVLYNGFQDRVRIYNVSLGAAPATVCLRRRNAVPPTVAAAAPATGARAGLLALAGDATAAAAAASGSAAPAAPEGVNDAAAANARRGYGDPALHSLPLSECDAMAVRQSLAHMLMGGAETKTTSMASSSAASASASTAAAGDTVTGTPVLRPVDPSVAAGGSAAAPNASAAWDESQLPFRVGALRLSAAGWEGWILDGAAPWLERHRPGVVLLEFAPALVARSGYPGGGVALLNRLYDLGYVHIAHTGYVCDERWWNITRALRNGGTALGDLAAPGGSHGQGEAASHPGAAGGPVPGPAAVGDAGALPRQPTWCKLKPDLFHLLTERAHPEVAENVLFIHHTHTSVRNEAQPQNQASAQGTAQGEAQAQTQAAGQAQAQGPVQTSAVSGGKAGVELQAGTGGDVATVQSSAVAAAQALAQATSSRQAQNAHLRAAETVAEGPRVVAGAMAGAGKEQARAGSLGRRGTASSIKPQRR